MERAKRYFINALILSGCTLLMRTVGVAFNAFCVDRVGAEGMGLFSLVMSVYTFAVTFATSGVNLAAMPLRQVFGNGKTYVMSFLRLIVMPLALYPLFRLLLGGCGIGILLPVVIFLAGMPCASTTPVLAEAAGLREEARLCSLGVLVSTVFSVVTIPLLYALTEWLGA